jgi:hypothetical protein
MQGLQKGYAMGDKEMKMKGKQEISLVSDSTRLVWRHDDLIGALMRYNERAKKLGKPLLKLVEVIEGADKGRINHGNN